MAIPRLFKVPKNRQYNYRPIYYDADKEEFQERIRKIEMEVRAEQNSQRYTPSIKRGSMRGYFREVEKTKRQSNIRLVIILLALFAAAYYFIYSHLTNL